MIKQNKIVKSFAFLVLVVIAFSCGSKREKQQTEINPEEEISKEYAYGICIDSLNLDHYKIASGDHLSAILMNLGFTGSDAEQITETNWTKRCIIHSDYFSFLSTLKTTNRE